MPIIQLKSSQQQVVEEQSATNQPTTQQDAESTIEQQTTDPQSTEQQATEQQTTEPGADNNGDAAEESVDPGDNNDPAADSGDANNPDENNEESGDADGEGGEQTDGDQKLALLFTNDVHANIKYQEPFTDSKGNYNHGRIGYDFFAGLVQAFKNDNTYNDVHVASSGDDISGGLNYGFISNGEWPIQLMNEVGYDAFTPGNHEFDFGVDRLDELMNMLNVNVVSSNFYNKTASGNQRHFDPYKIVQHENGKKIAYVGITTPESMIKSSPKHFIDSNGNYMYYFCEDETGDALYDNIQTSIDQAIADGAELVVALGHTGDENDSGVNPI